MAWLFSLLGRLVPLAFLLLVLRALYRITFHPLARIPGPKLAGLTSLWAASYDLSGTDSLVKHLKSLHDKYGPLVRVRPNEVHIFDWEAYHTVFRQGSKFSRPGDFYNAPQTRGSLLNQCDDPKAAKHHRDLFTQAFSKHRVQSLEPLIHEKLTVLLQRLREAATSGTVVNLEMALQCLTADVTMHYSYQMDQGMLNTPEFKPKLLLDMKEMGPLVTLFWYLPMLGTVMSKLIFEWLPDSFVRKYFPAAVSAKDMVKDCKALISKLMAAPVESEEVQNSIFSTALTPSEKRTHLHLTPHEMTGDAVLMFLAGTDTTAHALTFGIWEAMKQPKIWVRLREDVQSVLRNSRDEGFLLDLEQLPYLKAFIKESLRFSMGTSARLPRIVPPEGATLAGQYLPAGTVVSFSHYVYNNDPEFFPDPHVFKPERWLCSKEEAEILEAHMISFSRGSRSCIGMNLAYAEMYTALAHLVRRFDFENAGTTDGDMVWLDRFTPFLQGEFNVRVRVVD